jgi:hypothetical protein
MKPGGIKLCVVTIACVLFISGCASNTQNVDLAICGSYSVPGMLCADLKGGSYECIVLEQDSQGRIMYTYTAHSIITEKKEQVVVICQKRDNDAVYYYQDICYLLKEWTSDDLALLKEKNDWEKPLDDSKMVGKSNITTLDNYFLLNGKLEYAQVKQGCCKDLDVAQKQIGDLCLIDTNGKMELYWLTIIGGSGEECYFVLVDEDYNNAYLPADRTMRVLEDLPVFKQNNGWG